MRIGCVIQADFGNWLAGLIDGEGSFNIVVGTKRTIPTPFPTFHVAFRDDDMALLKTIHEVMKIGRIYREAKSFRNGRNNNPAARWVVAAANECVLLCDVLRSYPLRSKKRFDFYLWEQAVRLYASTLSTGNGRKTSDVKRARDSRLFELKYELEQQRKYTKCA